MTKKSGPFEEQTGLLWNLNTNINGTQLNDAIFDQSHRTTENKSKLPCFFLLSIIKGIMAYNIQAHILVFLITTTPLTIVCAHTPSQSQCLLSIIDLSCILSLSSLDLTSSYSCLTFIS